MAGEMCIRDRIRRAVKKPFRDPELSKWQERLETAKKEYQAQYALMDEREALYLSLIHI